LPSRGGTEPAPSSSGVRDPTQDAERFVGDDRFLVQRRLGSGAFGVVYEAYDRVEKALVALKVLRVADADALYRFKKGFRSLADLRHPNLVSFYELTIHEGIWFFSMELIAGRELTDALGVMAASDSGGRPALGSTDYRRVRHVLRQLASGLHAVHESGRVHRDIKPPNVLVTAADQVKLLDFGLATELGGRYVAEAEPQMVGTPAYMAPEQADGLPGSPASDWYSVGVMLYQMITGTLPFDGSLIEIITGKQKGIDVEHLREQTTALPPDLEALCLGLLDPEPDQRLDGAEVLARLGGDCGSTASSGVYPLAATRSKQTESGTHFVGRDDHLAHLDEALEASRQRAAVVHLSGPSGIGKSALVQRFVDHVEDRFPESVVLAGRCYVQESVPYKAVDSLIDALSRHLRALKRSAVEAILPARIAELSRLFPVLRRVPAVADVPPPIEVDDELPEIRRRAFGALHELLVGLGTEHPVVLSIDDLQWGDLDSFELLDELFGSPEPLPVLFVACYRSEEVDTSPFLQAMGAVAPSARWGSAESHVIELGELSTTEGRELLQRLGGLGDGDEVAALLEESAGSPLYLSEVARFAGGRPSGESAVAAAGGTQGRLRDLILSRVDLLGSAARGLLDVVSVAGQPLALDVAFDAAALEAGGVSAVAELRSERLVRVSQVEGVERIETYHDRVREAVTGRLGADGLRRLHGDLARALESSGQAAPETLAVHYRATAEDELARRYAVTAAGRAEEALAFDRAARLYRLAIDLLSEEEQTSEQPGSGEMSDERYALHVRLATALGNAGRNRHAAETLLRAVGESGTIDPLESQRFAAEKLLISGHIDRGLSVLQHVLRTVDMELDPRPWRTLIRLWWWRTRL
ncbi:MAG: protein kinase, partial [Acidobacteriota bacterium]